MSKHTDKLWEIYQDISLSMTHDKDTEMVAIGDTRVLYPKCLREFGAYIVLLEDELLKEESEDD